MRHMQNLAVAMGALCILYFLAIWIVAVHGTNFYFIWLVIRSEERRVGKECRL